MRGARFIPGVAEPICPVKIDGTREPGHLVQFCEDEQVLVDRAAEFLGAGLEEGSAILVIVTPARAEAFLRRLAARGLDVEGARATGQVTVVDAEATLSRLMAGTMPDPRLFERILGGLLEEAARPPGRRRVRAFTEMIDLLWRGGNPQAALRLEELWNELDSTDAPDVLCGYVMGHLHVTPDERGRRDGGRTPAPLSSSPEGAASAALVAAGPGDEKAGLERRLRALLAELAARRELEAQLRHAVRELRQSEERARVAARRTAELQEVTSNLASAVTVAEVVETFLALSRRLFGAAAGVVYLADGAGRFRLQGAHGLPAMPDELKVLSPDAPLPLAEALRTRSPVWLDTYQDLIARHPGAAAARTPAANLQAVAALPLIQGSELLGGFALSFPTSHRFDQHERQWVTRFASQLSIAVARARSYAAEQEARAEAEMLLRVAESLNARQLDLDAVVQQVTNEATAAVGARFGAFFYNVTGPDGESYRLYTLCGAPREAFQAFAPPRNTPLFAPTFAGEKVVRLGEVEKDERYGKVAPHHGMPPGHLPVTSYLAVPVVSRSGSVIGGLFFGHPEADRFTEQHERVVSALAANAAVAIDNARLYQATRQAEETHRSLVDELTETVRVNETLVGVLAHDLRNPLHAILTSAQLAQTRTDSDGLTRPLARIVSSAERMGRMVEQLLDLARIRIGEGMPLEPEPCDLEPLLRHVVDELDGGDGGDRWVHLEVQGDTGGRWDPDRLGQVFSNLVGNALQHRSEGVVRVSVDGNDPGQVQVRVHNQGVVAPELVPKLFDPLTGGERRRGRPRGLGLGLFITQQIARAHGGRVEVESSAREGTTFTVCLPRLVDQTGTAARPAASRPLQEAKERAWQSEQRMRLLVDSIRDCAIFMLDIDGRVSSWNRGAERLEGWTAPEVLGKHFSLFFSAEEAAAGRPEQELRQAREVGTSEAEGWRVRKDGSRFWANVMIGAVRDTAGTLIGYYKVTRDLTDRRRAEQELRDRETRLRMILDGVKDAIYMLDPAGNVRTWNAGAELTKGYLREEIVGKHFSTFFTPEARAAGQPQQLLSEAAQRGRVEDEGWRVRKDGSRFWANVVITALRDPGGELAGYTKVVRDLTERHRAQEELRRSEERFRLMVDAVKDYAIFMLDPTGRVATWNRGAERLKQYRAAEIIGQHFSRFYPEEVARSGLCERELEVAAREGRFEDEGWRVRKDGSRFWANVVITALRGRDGQLLGFTKVTRDRTDRRKLEEERVRLAQAQEAIRLRDEFLSLAAHELKTPLTGLQIQLEALQEGIAGSDAGLTRKVRRAALSGNRLADLVESLLDVSQIATGQFDLSPTTVDLAGVVGEVVDGLRPAALKIGCELSARLEPDLWGRWDRVRIEQLVTNLLSNAIKYGAGRPIVISVAEVGAEVLLEVRDHGPGIVAEEITRLFDRFERAASARHHGGLGLGLYLVREIARAHGGSVSARNAPGGGASFTVRLPREPRPSSPGPGLARELP